MIEKRCLNSGALLFFPSNEDLQKQEESKKILDLEKKNKYLDKKIKKLETLVKSLIKE